MKARASRADSTARNRSTLLAAARKVFLKRGFHGASLETIALEAGFSKGVVYSQFDSKSDLFLSLLAERQAERLADNHARAATLSGGAGLLELMRHWSSTETSESAWTLLVIEFRVHAARDREIGRRYAALHEQTVVGLAEVIETVYRNAATLPPLAPEAFARALLAFGNGAALERASDPKALPLEDVASLFEASTAGEAAPAARKRKASA